MFENLLLIMQSRVFKIYSVVKFIRKLLSIRLSGLCFFVCMILVCDGLVGVRILGFLFLSPGCILGWCVWQMDQSIGCTNNNYASREKCKKCGQPKEVAAMPAIAMPGASLQTYPHYFARAQGVQDQHTNLGLLSNLALQHSLPLTSNWSLTGADKYGVQQASTWPLGGTLNNGVPYGNQANQLMVPKGWRNGDWICNCGFHNYSSRAQVWPFYRTLVEMSTFSQPTTDYLTSKKVSACLRRCILFVYFFDSAKNAMLLCHQVHPLPWSAQQLQVCPQV